MPLSKHSDHIAVGLVAGAALVWIVWGLLEPTSVTTSEGDDGDSLFSSALQAGLDATNATLAAIGIEPMVAPGRTQ
jgi:hypothetical protein